MLIRLIPPAPHPTILYGLTFPSILPLHDIPNATIPAAWSSQLQILTSVLQFEPPSSIHMLDRAVGLVARIREVSMNVSQKEFVVKFVDGRVTNLPMNSDCVRMLLGVVLDVKGCSESESQRNSMESSVCPGSTSDSTDDLPSGDSHTKSPKSGKHKRQRSLLFSLISSLVPKSLSLSPPAPSSAPPPAPLPPLPLANRVTSPSPRQTSFDSAQPNPDLLRKRARATLVDVWRRHVISALTPQHLPAAGFLEWTLVAMASKVRAEVDSMKTSHGSSNGSPRISAGRHRKTQSEGRKALDFGGRSDDCESEQWQCRAPSPLPAMLNAEDTDRVVYPRQEHADEWGVRYVHPRSEEADVFAIEYSGLNDSLLEEHFTAVDDWYDNERITVELSRMGRYGTSDINGHLSGFDDKHPHTGDFSLYSNDDDGERLADTAFDVSRCPLIPSDVNDDEESDDTQTSLRTPEDGEDLPRALPGRGSSRHASPPAPGPSSVCRVDSSRPRSRVASAQFSSPSSTPVHSSHSLTPSGAHNPTSIDEYIAGRFDYLERVCTALEIVRSRARDEGWRLIRATLIGAKNGWMDPETEASLETRAKRRAWSSGIKVSAPYPTPRRAPRLWDGRSSIFSPPTRPPGLFPPLTGVRQVRGPIVPTGLSLGVPLRSSPLALCVWGADDKHSSAPGKYGILTSVHSMETMEGKRTSRVSFADTATKLFPVCEEENEDLFEPVPANAVGFPQAVPLSVLAEEPECDLEMGLTENEDDPFCFCPSRPRTRTTSMYMVSPTSAASSSPTLPMFRPSTPPPSYHVAVGGDVSAAGNDEGGLDASALLLQPLSSLSVSPSSSSSSPRPPLTSNPPFVPRPRAVSLPTSKSHSSTDKARRTSLQHKDERFEDLSQAYASPPPEGPLVISATPAPHEEYPRYAHVHSPTPTSKKNHVAILGRAGREMVFEQAGSEFTVGIEVALGRAEEGRVVW